MNHTSNSVLARKTVIVIDLVVLLRFLAFLCLFYPNPKYATLLQERSKKTQSVEEYERENRMIAPKLNGKKFVQKLPTDPHKPFYQ